jgi:hypothetical protein
MVIGPRQDTGHPFGLYCCMVAADGHVTQLANHADLVPRIKAMAALFAELGLDGAYRIEWLTLEDSTRRYAAGLGCDGCRIRLSCGCDIVQDVLTGQCPHGVREAVMAAAKRSGYLDAVPPPPGGKAGLDAYAQAIVELDAARPDASTLRDGRPPRRRGKRRRPGRRR